jgi:hypothetical protein
VNEKAAGTARGLAAAVPAAFYVAVAGTALHRHDILIGDVGLPWGAAAALLLLASVELWLAAAFASLVPAAVCGVLCYALAGWWSTLENGKRLVIGDAAGSLWIYGIAVVTAATLLWARRHRMGPG